MQALLPCSACLTGKMRKANKATAKDFTAIENLALSWTAGTAKKNVRPNEIMAVDWGIINETSISGKNNVFALYLDLNTGLVFTYPAPSRGLAGPSLQAYIQRYGPPATILSDNAKEFAGSEFAEICKTKEITQKISATYNPNQNPVEHYMEIISSKTQSLLAISGLEPNEYWEIALEYATNL
jgi:transposase InsO family protein